VGVLGASIILVVAGALGTDLSTLALSGFACLPLAVATFLATNLASRRDSRSGTEELLAALPGTPSTRTVAQLLAVAPSVAVVAVAAAAVAVFALGGPEVRFATGVERRVPSLPELAQGPLAVTVLGLAGVAVGRFVPTGLVAPVLAVVLLVSIWPEGGLRWFAPVINPAVTVPGGYWPHPEIAPRTELIGFDVASIAWHLLYLVGLGGLAAAVAVARHGGKPAAPVAAVTALVVAAAGGLLQLR